MKSLICLFMLLAFVARADEMPQAKQALDDPKYQCLAWMATYEVYHPDDEATAINKAKLELVMKLKHRYNANTLGDYIDVMDDSAAENSFMTKNYLKRCNELVEQYTQILGFTYGLK